MNTKLILEWGIFFSFVGLLIYAMLAIKDEKSTFFENARTQIFFQFNLMIPHWWSKNEEKSAENELIFFRKDTRYDWQASFKKVQFDEQALKEKLNNVLKEKNIILDLDQAFSHPPSVLKVNELVISKELEIAKIEGTGTRDQEDRVYYDCYIIRDHKNKDDFIFESVSSVLNGMVEGPYFEEVLQNLKYES